MICCLNPDCPRPLNPDKGKFCLGCGTPLVPCLINRFKVYDVLAQGGFGRTYLATDTQKLGEKCVVKQFIYQGKGVYSTQKAESLFVAEARKLQALGSHPQIPALHAFFGEGGYQYLVQEFVEGQTLKAELVNGVFTEAQIWQILQDLLPVLEFVHEQGVLHRDIKPDNIMRRRSDGKLILIDFGIAKSWSRTQSSQTGTSIGSQGYSSKEQLLEGKSTPASDLFSLGVSCFHLLTKSAPFQLSVNFGFSWVERWEEFLPQPLSPQLNQVLRKLLATNAEDRYQSAREILEEFASKSIASTASKSPGVLPFASQERHQNTAVAQNQSSARDRDVPTQPHKALLKKTNRRMLLKLLGLGGVGLGIALLWRQFGLNDRSSVQPVTSSVSKPEPRPVSFTSVEIETVQVNRRGEIQDRFTEQIELFQEDLGQEVVLEMVSIPAGRFLMGSPFSESGRDEDESPQHWVELSAFLMGRYEITQAQWQRVAAFPQVKIPLEPDFFQFQGPTRPVERVTWFEAQEFCDRLSWFTGRIYSLPSESQWEYACRAGSESTFFFGPTLSSDVSNFDATQGYGQADPGEFRKRTIEVGSFPPNTWGLADMHGNILEWCQDNLHRSYEGAPTDGSPWVEGGNASRRILRGGSWFDYPRICRSANRSDKPPKSRDADVGFRVVCSLNR